MAELLTKTAAGDPNGHQYGPPVCQGASDYGGNQGENDHDGHGLALPHLNSVQNKHAAGIEALIQVNRGCIPTALMQINAHGRFNPHKSTATREP